MLFFNKKKNIDENKYACVIDGEVKNVTEAPDPVFSGKVLGDGYVVFPTGVEVVAPISGKITVLTKELHSFAIKNSSDEVLVHVGVDTVKLQGKGFEAFKKVGDKVKAGEKILKVDFESIQSEIPSTATMVILTNLSEKNELQVTLGNAKAGEIVMTKVDKTN